MRPLSDTDEALFCELYCDPQTMRFIGPPLSGDRAALSFRKALELTRRPAAGRLFWTLIEKVPQQTIGICSIQQLDARRRRAEAGIMIKPAARSQGFAREGLAALVSHAFAMLPLDEVWLETAAAHFVVERLVLGVGFSPSLAAAGGGEHSGQRTWSAFRRSWRYAP